MDKNWYYNNIPFRITSPLIVGMVVYLLVLLFFDSVDQLFTNMFSREAIFVIVLTLVFLELNRLVIIVSNKILPFENNIKTRIMVQVGAALLITVAVISVILNWYFIEFEGFSTITTELITFNIIYVLIVIFSNLYYFSIAFLHSRNDTKIAEEFIRKSNLELEMENFKYQVNPDFLFQSLEIIISELRRNKKQADDLVNNLASVYRFTLDNKDEDLVPVSEEADSLIPVLKLFKSKYGDGIRYKIDIDSSCVKHLIPGTLRLVFESAVIQNIISDSIPLIFEITNDKSHIIIEYSLNEKLQVNKQLESRIEQLKKAYTYLSNFGVLCDRVEGSHIVKIPLLSFDEE